MNPLLTDKVQVRNRLQELMLSKEILLSAVDAMVGARASCTANDPPSAPGYLSWCYGIRRLREELIPLGWERSEVGQLSSVYNQHLNINLVVSNTDDGTGLVDRQPTNRSKKGAATDRAIFGNQILIQEEMFTLAASLKPAPQPSNGMPVHWYLCVYCEGDAVRAELSCPIVCENGYFKDFYERIVLIGKDDNYDGGLRVRDSAPDTGGDAGFEINVTKKTV